MQLEDRSNDVDFFLMDNACHAVAPVAWCLEQGLENARAASPELFDNEQVWKGSPVCEGETWWFGSAAMESR